MKPLQFSQVEFYQGQKAGTRLLKAIKSANKSIRIISPFVSTDFAVLLVDKSKSGIDVSLITSTELMSSHDGKRTIKVMHKIQHKTSSIFKNKSVILLNLICWVLSFLFAFIFEEKAIFFLGFFLSVLFTTIFGKKKGERKTSPLFNLKIVRSPTHVGRSAANGEFLMHTKLYIIDERIAYSGSLNFTKAGFFNNFESILTISDSADVSKLVSQFNEILLHKSLSLYKYHGH